MRLTLECYILLFFTGAFLGWVMEVVCKLIQFGRFINRGFLIGPYCPIYGFGAVLVTALLSPFSASPPAVFVLAMAVCGTLEYLTSYAMENCSTPVGGITATAASTSTAASARAR